MSEHGEGALLLRAAQADPQLAAFAANLPALHARLAALSEALAAADPEASFFRQLTFSGENANPLFVPNRFKPDMGEDGRKIRPTTATPSRRSYTRRRPWSRLRVDALCGRGLRGGGDEGRGVRNNQDSEDRWGRPTRARW